VLSALLVDVKSRERSVIACVALIDQPACSD
jgi:hypothetical protein